MDSMAASNNAFQPTAPLSGGAAVSGRWGEMNAIRVIGRIVVSLFFAWLATVVLFFIVAAALGQLSFGAHSDAALVYLLLPVLWGVAFWLLGRVPSFRAVSESTAKSEGHV